MVQNQVKLMESNYGPKKMLRAHIFSDLMYSLSDALGHWPKGRKSEMRNRTNYDSHRKHFETVLIKLTNDLHAGSNLPSLMLSNHIDILESICTAILRTPLMPNIESNEYMILIYIKHALIPLMCADISIFKDDASEESIYYHFDRWLTFDDLITRHDDNLETLNKLAAKKHLQKYIDCNFTTTTKVIIKPIVDYVALLTKKGNRTASTLKQKVAESISYIESKRPKNIPSDLIEIYDCVGKLSEDEKNTLKLNIRKLSSFYTAFTVLQHLESEISLVSHLYRIYNSLHSEDNNPLLKLKESLLFSLKEDYSKNDHFEQRLESSHKNKQINATLEKKKYIIQVILEELCIQFQSVLPIPNSAERACVIAAEEEWNFLSRMVSLPPNFNSTIKNNYNDLDSSNYKRISPIGIPVFNKNNFLNINALANSRNSKFQLHYDLGSYLVFVLSLLQDAMPEKALSAIDYVPREKLPLFGFIRHSLAILKIGLMYRIKRNKIKHESLTEQVNDIINHQGIVIISIPRLHTLTNDGYFLDDAEYIKHSIVAGDNTYNTIVIQAIYAYNFTISRHATTEGLYRDASNHNLNRVMLTEINYINPLIVRGLLDELNRVSRKFLSELHKMDLESEPNIFLDMIIKERVLTEAELQNNLIHCIDGSTLSACLLDYLTIIMFLSVPGDEIGYIFELGNNIKLVELLFKATCQRVNWQSGCNGLE